MLAKLCDLFAGLKVTVISGIFLLASLILIITGKELPVDPAWVTVVLSGYPLLYLAISRLIYEKWVSSCLLISMAMAASLFVGELFAAGMVAFIMSIGAILEDMTIERAKKGLSQLIALAPAQGRLLVREGDKLVEKIIPAEDIKTGNMLRILPGETVPTDGKIITGETSVDQSVVTGESLPVDKAAGDEVFCGTVNCFGSVDIEATSDGNDSSLQKLIKMVEHADEKKAPTQRVAEKWSVWLVPIALFIAIAAVVINLAMGMDTMPALTRGVTVLVVFCPCALALATPTAVMAAIGQATKKGVIIKSGEALETMGRADTIAFDKTGTLTYGKLEVSDVYSSDKAISTEYILTLTGAVEARSEHPLGKAVFAHAKNMNLDLPEVKEFSMDAGRGVQGLAGEEKVFCGNEKYLEANGISVTDDVVKALAGFRDQGKASVLVGLGSRCIGAIALSDVIRPEAKQMISQLNELDVNTVLLTGDNKRAAEHFAKEADIREIRADLLPGEKLDAVEALCSAGKTVCMIGDGVNDAPALKAANVSAAMGKSGSDIAIEAANIALMSDDISKVVYLKKLANKTLKTIKLNITLSMCINAVAVTMSVLGLLTPVTGALVHNAGSVLVVLNAALLYDRKFD